MPLPCAMRYACMHAHVHKSTRSENVGFASRAGMVAAVLRLLILSSAMLSQLTIRAAALSLVQVSQDLSGSEGEWCTAVHPE